MIMHFIPFKHGWLASIPKLMKRCLECASIELDYFMARLQASTTALSINIQHQGYNASIMHLLQFLLKIIHHVIWTDVVSIQTPASGAIHLSLCGSLHIHCIIYTSVLKAVSEVECRREVYLLNFYCVSNQKTSLQTHFSVVFIYTVLILYTHQC